MAVVFDAVEFEVTGNVEGVVELNVALGVDDATDRLEVGVLATLEVFAELIG